MPRLPDVLQELHQQQLEKLKRQRMAPVPIILEPQFTQNLTYGNVPVIVPRSVGLNADLNLESCMRSILSAVNTITTATTALVDESKGASKDEMHDLQEQLGQEQLLTEQLQTQNNDIKQQLEREKELVQHSKDEVARLRAKCQELTQANKEAMHDIKQLRGAKRGYKALHNELGRELDRRFIFESVASIIKAADSEGAVSFNFEELEELTNTMISKIHDASKDNDYPLFKELVTEYMTAWKESQRAAEKSDEEEDEDQEDNEEEKNDEGKGDDDDDDDNDGDDDQGPSTGKDQATGKEDDEEEEREQREESPPRKRMLVLEGKYANTLQEKERAPRANNTLMLARALSQSCRTQNKDLYGKLWPCARCLGSGNYRQSWPRWQLTLRRGLLPVLLPHQLYLHNIHLQRKGWCS